jgi:cysteine-rich repeat protein
MGCASGTAGAPACSDGQDNDGDQLTDYPDDPDCESASDPTESSTTPGTCGDGILNEGEVCDDGNTMDGDTCRGDCGQDYTLCGNGNLDPGEACDDGNTVDGDGCRGDCGQDLTLCGNGQLDPGEICDDGLPPGQSVCSEDCTANNGPCTHDLDCMACHYCDVTDHCAPAEADTDPKEDCPTEAPSTCGTTGVCDGQGRCTMHGPDTLCQDAECNGTVLNMPRYCNGQGECRAGDTIDCAPDDCQLPDAPGSGPACGLGDPVVLTNDATSPQEHTFTGNLLVSGGINWYRVGAVASGSELNIYVWFEVNPNNEFAFQVQLGEGNVDDCSDGQLQCAADVPYNRYSYAYDQCDPSCNELGRNVYIGVQRSPGATPTCSMYTLKIRVGGTTDPW